MAKNNEGLSQQTYEYILELIMTKQLLPGKKIPEMKIAKEFGISRSPVREALHKLHNEGLITIFPNRFAQVEMYDEKKICDIGTLRIALDRLSIKLALLFGNQIEFLKLKELAEKCYAAYKANDYQLRLKADCDFHLELANISKNDQLIKFQSELYLQVQFLMLHHPYLVKDEVTHLLEHVSIADALINHDEEVALQLIQDHLTSFYNLKEKYPQSFF